MYIRMLSTYTCMYMFVLQPLPTAAAEDAQRSGMKAVCLAWQQSPPQCVCCGTAYSPLAMSTIPRALWAIHVLVHVKWSCCIHMYSVHSALPCKAHRTAHCLICTRIYTYIHIWTILISDSQSVVSHIYIHVHVPTVGTCTCTFNFMHL